MSTTHVNIDEEMLTCCSAYAHIVSVISIIPEVSTILARSLGLTLVAILVQQIRNGPAQCNNMYQYISQDYIHCLKCHGISAEDAMLICSFSIRPPCQ